MSRKKITIITCWFGVKPIRPKQDDRKNRMTEYAWPEDQIQSNINIHQLYICFILRTQYFTCPKHYDVIGVNFLTFSICTSKLTLILSTYIFDIRSWDFFGLLVFYSFSCLVIYSVIRFSIYSVLWIRSNSSVDLYYPIF